MAIVTRSEFAAICNTTTAVIATNVSRKKINSFSDKTIDTNDPLNKIFLKLRKQKDIKDALNVRQQKKKPEPEESKEAPVKKTPRKKSSKEEQENSSLILRKLRAETSKAEKDNEIKTLTLEKMTGKLIPVDLMTGILKINIQNIFRSFENELMNIASIYCDIMAAGDRGKLSEVIDLMRQNLHRIIKETKTNAAKEIEGVINEYAETRSRGERK